MDQQRDEFLGKASPNSSNQNSSSVSEIITIATGEGIHELFRSVGASEVIESCSTMNPSVDQIVASINQAIKNVSIEIEKKMNSITGGMLGNMKLPGM